MFTLAEADWMARLGELLQFRLASCLALAAALFCIGVWGVIARRNALLMLISVELMLGAVMLAFAGFARAQVNLAARAGETPGQSGQIFALFILALAAAEAAVGLAIVVACFRNRASVDTRDFKDLRD
jgi:NADH-quinone oxidoreductase subunit K